MNHITVRELWMASVAVLRSEVKSGRIVVESLHDFSLLAKCIIFPRKKYSLSQQILKKLHNSKVRWSKYTNNKNQPGVNYPEFYRLSFNKQLSYLHITIVRQMILLCAAIILSMVDLTTVHTVIKFSRKVETG